MQQRENVNQGAFAVTASLVVAFIAWVSTQVLTVPYIYSLPLTLLVALVTGVVIAAWPTGKSRPETLQKRAPIADWARVPVDIDEALYWDLFENATDIVFTTDVSGHFVTGNKAVERLLGYTVQEAQQLTWEKLVAPYEMDKARRMFKRHARGERFIHYELDVVVKGGEIRTFEIGSRPLFEEGDLVGFHGIARDVTERKRIQDAAIVARREAEQASRAKSVFLANMSHEVRTPINGILGFLSLLSKTELDREQRNFLQPIEQSAQNLLRIVDDILDLSKIEAGKISIDREVIRFSDVVRGAVELQRTFAAEKKLQLEVKIAGDIPPYLIGDETRIAQVVGNLVNNAIKFTEKGRVTVTAQLQDQTEHMVRVRLIVHDTGIGIPPDSVRKLFEPFQQLERSRRRRSAGSGLGLTITKSLVTAMGGETVVASEPGVYTEVSVVLPLERASGRERRRTAFDQKFDGRGLRALVVDDNEINLRYLVTLLQSLNIVTLEAQSGYDAIDILKIEQVDLVLMDLHMAGMDGVETTRQIRSLPGGKKLPVVIISADVMGDEAAWEEQGIDGFVAKPVQEQVLCHTLSDLFSYPIQPADKAASMTTSGSVDLMGKDQQVLDPVRGVELASGNKDLWQRSVRALVDMLPGEIAAMRDAVGAKDWPALKQRAHRIKGTARYIAACDLERAAQQLEQCCNTQQQAQAGAALDDLSSATDRLLALAGSLPV